MNKQPAVNDPNRIQIITMLYEGAANFTRMARDKMEIADSSGKALYLRKTSAIIWELLNSLNMEGGDVARNLRDLYNFVLNCLHKAETQNNIEALDEAEKVIEILKRAWQEMQERGNTAAA